MSIEYNHVRLNSLDNEGNEKVVYPYNTDLDVQLTTQNNTAIPEKLETLKNLINQLGVLAFSNGVIDDSDDYNKYIKVDDDYEGGDKLEVVSDDTPDETFDSSTMVKISDVQKDIPDIVIGNFVKYVEYPYLSTWSANKIKSTIDQLITDIETTYAKITDVKNIQGDVNNTIEYINTTLNNEISILSSSIDRLATTIDVFDTNLKKYVNYGANDPYTTSQRITENPCSVEEPLYIVGTEKVCVDEDFTHTFNVDLIPSIPSLLIVNDDLDESLFDSETMIHYSDAHTDVDSITEDDIGKKVVLFVDGKYNSDYIMYLKDTSWNNPLYYQNSEWRAAHADALFLNLPTPDATINIITWSLGLSTQITTPDTSNFLKVNDQGINYFHNGTQKFTTDSEGFFITNKGTSTNYRNSTKFGFVFNDNGDVELKMK